MKTFYKKLIEVFENNDNKSKFVEQEITPVGYVDLYAGQDQFEENFELFTQPALFVEWNIDHQTTPPTATVTLYCCYEQLRDTSNISLNQELGLKFLDFINTIDEIVQNIESDATGKLELESEGFNKLDSIVDIYLFTYKCSYTPRKNPQRIYQEGDYDSLNLTPNMIKYDFED